ncbi:transporter, nhac family protein [Halogeometricum borinquense DSM 11551]|uniref:Transporter, NhaC family n=2 Tax=Halogeometricum borinquense TaxID=60847 RepID=E4NTC0_HALBP|nr:Na+/H+ antiporter NhaC family protein [Halogeometricum borinquense]ADQ68217.1 transporter, NhaC family [Halogeometricum borinquense DSM 11551]ELY24739.1 transporter, nhac family protein [Halogeometricum borinquense DSM 11551]RYJ12888.1 arginine:ornithine antiporter [Halogeometricum borinquense]
MATLSFEPLTYGDIPEDERPSFRAALVPVFGMLVFLSVGAIALDLDPQLPLLFGIAFTGIVGRYWYGTTWAKMYEGIVDGLRMGMQAILIIFVIYMLISTWTGAGTIPSLIYYGLELLSPSIFLPIATILAAVVAFAIGSSWTTAGTLGVAFIGIGTGLGIPEPMTAGAVLTGAYTGDKVSPLSDTTNLAAAVTNTDLMTHVRTMRVGTGIAMLLSLALYTYLGLTATGNIPPGRIAEIQTAISGTYTVSPLTFAPLVLTFALALRGYPALPAITSGVFAGVATQIFVQGPISIEGFVRAMEVAQSGTAAGSGAGLAAEFKTGSEIVNNLLFTEGLIGSSWTITVVVAALALGGILERTGVLAVIAYHIGESLHSVGSLTAGTALSAFGMNILAAEQYMSIVVPGMSLRGLYDDFDLDSRNLSRAVEAAGTTTSALIPWNAGGVYMVSVLDVPVCSGAWCLDGYAPFYFLGFFSPTILILMGVTGWRITTQSEDTTVGIKGAVESLGDD